MSLGRKFYQRDSQLADALLRGYVTTDEDGRLAIEFLSSKTSPTEKEAQAGLARLLLAFAKKLMRGPLRHGQLRGQLAMLLADLAQAFDAKLPVNAETRYDLDMDDPAIKIKGFAKVSKGHPNKIGKLQIGQQVERLIESGLPKLEVYDAVAKKYRLRDKRKIERIFSEYRQECRRIDALVRQRRAGP